MTSDEFSFAADPDPIRDDFLHAYCEYWEVSRARAIEMLEHVFLSLAPETLILQSQNKILRVEETDMTDSSPEFVAFTVYVSREEYDHD